jgi:hypothetical protein
MKPNVTGHISPAAIAIALFFAWALLAHGATITVLNNDTGATTVCMGRFNSTKYAEAWQTGKWIDREMIEGQNSARIVSNDNLSKAGWSWGCVSALANGRTIWSADTSRQRKAFRCACG